MHSRLLLTLALLAASMLWLGATPPSLPPPTAVVFPLTVNGDADKESGNRLAVLFAQQLADNGVKVVPPPPGTPRSEFLSSARKLGADYYITGFITPLGAEVTVVEQIVSTASGTVIASNSAQLLTYADASGQGAVLAVSILRHAGRALASLGENAPPAATPAPKESANEANLNGLGNIFKRKPKSSPSPKPSTAAVAAAPVPAALATASPLPLRTAPPPLATTAPAPASVAVNPPPPSAGQSSRVVIFDFGGTAASDRRAYARNDLLKRLGQSGQSVATVASVAPSDLLANASDLCTKNGAKVFVDGQLATRDGDGTYGPSTIAQFDVRAIDCSGRIVFQERFERDGMGRKNWERAIDNAVAAASTPLARALGGN
ncbi:MAG: hypothetical protein JO140_03800 [Candidatus Eremiobacteraeota bacterium]|nr:hypothetical protein [Candidatus Eremiobacteraeota bacterium]